jgi:hypothetical protein
MREFENGVLRELFGVQGEDLMGDWMNVHTVELLDTNSSNIIWEIKSKEKEYRSTRHVERGREVTTKRNT